MGLGSTNVLSLAEARKAATAQARILLDGIDPIVKRDSEKQSNLQNQAWTFDRCAKVYIDSNEVGWRNAKHAQQWRNTLATYASPIFGNLPAEEIDLHTVLRVIEPIWETKNETASRVRGRIEKVLSWAIAKGHRPAPNPAVWKGNLDAILPSPKKVQKKTAQHQPALPYPEIGVFVKDLKAREAISAKALLFLILTASRTNEVVAASWDEFDLKAGNWTIPGNRMKAGRDHRVPLSSQALALLETLPRLGGWVFPSPEGQKHLSNGAMRMLLIDRMKRPDVTVHGFRSTFRVWASEETNYPREIAEAALAHVIGNKAEQAYSRGDLLERRRELMQEWADIATSESNKIIPMNRKVRQ